MFGRLNRRLAVLAAAPLAVAAVPAAAMAAGNPIGPGQYFAGSVIGVTGTTAIDVLCVTATGTGHPAGGQEVGVSQVYPPVSSVIGFTGLTATSINAELTWPTPITPPPPVHVATFTSYGTLPIPQTITVPCSGTGVMSFVPSPFDGARSATVDVTFVRIIG